MFNLWLDIDFVRDLNFWGVSRVEKTVSRIKFWTFSSTKLFFIGHINLSYLSVWNKPPSFHKEKTWEFCKSTRRPFFTKKKSKKVPSGLGNTSNSKKLQGQTNVCKCLQWKMSPWGESKYRIPKKNSRVTSFCVWRWKYQYFVPSILYLLNAAPREFLAFQYLGSPYSENYHYNYFKKLASLGGLFGCWSAL